MVDIIVDINFNTDDLDEAERLRKAALAAGGWDRDEYHNALMGPMRDVSSKNIVSE